MKKTCRMRTVTTIVFSHDDVPDKLTWSSKDNLVRLWVHGKKKDTVYASTSERYRLTASQIEAWAYRVAENYFNDRLSEMEQG